MRLPSPPEDERAAFQAPQPPPPTPSPANHTATKHRALHSIELHSTEPIHANASNTHMQPHHTRTTVHGCAHVRARGHILVFCEACIEAVRRRAIADQSTLHRHLFSEDLRRQKKYPVACLFSEALTTQTRYSGCCDRVGWDTAAVIVFGEWQSSIGSYVNSGMQTRHMAAYTDGWMQQA